MSIAAPPRPPVRRPPTAVSPERRPPPPGSQPNCTAAWTLVGVLLAFKAVTITLILIVARPDDGLVVKLVAMNWLWLIVLGVLLSAIPFGLWFRLVRARSRRRQLQRSEWQV
jgi:hypothetical protein